MTLGLPRITVVGLGPAGPEFLTAGTLDLLGSGDPVWLRTGVHPAAEAVAATGTFDEVYEIAASFDAVYATIVDRLVGEAATHGHVVYAVPGSPAVAERTVELLRVDERVEVTVVPALSFLDLSWVALGVDPMAEGVTIVDALTLIDGSAARRGPLLITQVHSASVLDDLILALDDAEPESVTLLKQLGSETATIETVTWSSLRERVDPDHLTSLWIPHLREPVGASFARFELLVERLRRECPWDAEQTHESLRPYLLEETYEVLEALDAVTDRGEELYPDLEEELGDLLFQIFIHARLAAEAGWFTMSDVATGVHDKLVRRHPHVFGDADAATTIAGWDEAKQAEKRRASALDGIPATLPALMAAIKTQKRAASVGFSGPDLAWALSDVDDELAELREDHSEAELGDLLFASVQVARMLDVDPELALRGATQRFDARFRVVEELAEGADKSLADLPLEELQQLWQQAKATLAEP